jgi:hypothetical protein
MIERVREYRHLIRLAVSAIAGVLAVLFLRNDFFDEASQELIAVFGLMMAAVLPTMVLTATVLRSGGLSVKRIRDYRDALVHQVHIWAGLFLLSLLACTAVVVGKTIGWEFNIVAPTRLGGGSFNLATLLNGIIVALMVLLALRARAVIDGIRSLIDLSADIAMSEAQRRDDAAHREIEQKISQAEPRKGFGDYVSLKTGRKRKTG